MSSKKNHWLREKRGIFTPADIRHERRESFGYEIREHGLRIGEAERAIMGAQKKKYGGLPRSRYRLR